MDSLEAFITSWGYWGLALGTFLEGESILLLAGFMAYEDLLSLPVVMVIAAIGGTAGDQLFFYLGRYHRDWIFKKLPALRHKSRKVYAWIERHPDLLIIGCRFIYGFRITTPIIFGTSRVSAWRFSLFNIIGAVIWAILVSLAGYYLGNIMEKFVGNLHKVQHYIVAVILLIAAGFWVFHKVRAKREPPPPPDDATQS